MPLVVAVFGAGDYGDPFVPRFCFGAMIIALCAPLFLNIKWYLRPIVGIASVVLLYVTTSLVALAVTAVNGTLFETVL